MHEIARPEPVRHEEDELPDDLVEVTARELLVCAFVAQLWDEAGVKAGADPNKYGFEGSSLALCNEGVIPELVQCKATNRYWTGMGTDYHHDDDAGGIQTRGTPHLNGRLIIRPGKDFDFLDQPWVLVTGPWPVIGGVPGSKYYRRVGWIYGRDGVRVGWFGTHDGRPPCYWISWSDLLPIKTCPLP